jgi:ABC-type transporter Mla subunit MlaD
MTREISRTTRAISRTAREISRTAREISRTTREISRTTREISRTTREISRTAREISRTAREISRTTREISRTTREISRTAREISRTTREISRMTRERAYPAQRLLHFPFRRDRHPAPRWSMQAGPRLRGPPETLAAVPQSFTEDTCPSRVSRTEDVMKRLPGEYHLRVTLTDPAGTIQTRTAELTVAPGGGG